MKLRSPFIPCAFIVAVFAAAGCDLSSPKSERTGQTTVQPPCPGCGPETSPPFLLGFDCPDGQVLCPGDVCTLVGLNFSTVPEENEVFFQAGRGRVKGLPLRVRVDRGGGGGTDLQSSLDVLVPSGVTSGNVELVVRGRSAGSVGYSACPMIMGFTLGLSETEEFLFYEPLLGFQQGQSRVTLYGLNFNEVDEIIVSDSSGNSRRIPASAFIRNAGTRTVIAGNQRTGYDSIGFNLRDDNIDVRFPFQGDRGNMGVEVRGTSGSSNRIEIPISTNQAVQNLGAVISTVRVPPGVVTGPVRIEYAMYERIIDAAWGLQVSWSVDEGRTWNPAKPLDTHPDHDGTTKLTPGTVLHGGQFGLFPGGGIVRTFVWDACNDELFQELNQETQGTTAAPRHLSVRFRLEPVPETNNRNFIDHRVETPPVIYYYIQDRPEEAVPEQRRGEIVEDFATDTREDTRATNANWGPPLNPGSLEGNADTLTLAEIRQTEAPWVRRQNAPVPPEGGVADYSQYGTGTAVLELANVDPNQTPFGAQIVTQFIEIDTDRMTIERRFLLNNGTPGDTTDDFEVGEPIVLTDTNGRSVENPGEPFNEFHLSRLTIAEETLVRARGANPLIIRLNGDGDATDPEDVLFRCDGILDLNGGPGGPGTATDQGIPVFGLGGEGGPGGGQGGQGGALALFNPNSPRVRLFQPATAGEGTPGEARLPGEMTGGQPGESPAAANPNSTVPRSVFYGAPGGGGGHRLPGGDGDYGNPGVREFAPPRVGRGGVARGSPEQVPLTGGAGGGGGGATISLVGIQGVPMYVATGGAGGGGGGGAVLVVSRGSIEVNGEIQANGGSGGDGVRPPPGQNTPNGVDGGGAGGGGSGGSIVLRARGSIQLADCSSLQVNGGEAGSVSVQNRTPGAGDGAPGWVRLEAGEGGVPFCSDLSEAVVPDTESLAGGTLTRNPEPVAFGRARDGSLHLRFIPSVDPSTGEALVDEETGDPISIYLFNTETGELFDPLGNVLKRVRSASTRPGFLDLIRLQIDEGVWLVGFGPNPLEISVREVADIAGVISVSGFNGGPLRFEAPGRTPQPGIGGTAGAGGGRGGDGGTIVFLDGDPENKDPANTFPIDGQPGGIPPGTEVFDVTERIARRDAAASVVFPELVRSLGGVTLRGQPCAEACLDSAGGGGGGGNRRPGGDGGAVLLLPDPEREAELIGRGGSAFGTDSFRFEGRLFLEGGMGGAGGGANPHVSSAYATQRIAGRYPFPGQALYAPGTGGGGGGGVLHLATENLILHSKARLLARGGDAYQSIDLGGNGGGGAGGNILIQVENTFTMEPGARFDVRGGRANRLPPFASPGVRLYEGNIRSDFLDSEPDETGDPFGGLGGDGAPGRVRIEVPFASALAARGVNLNVTAGEFLEDTVVSVGVSQVIGLGFGPGRVAGAESVVFQPAQIRFNTLQQPPGTAAYVLWDGAGESPNFHAMAARLAQRVSDPRALREKRFVRFAAYFLSNFINRTSQSIREVRLPYRLEDCE